MSGRRGGAAGAAKPAASGAVRSGLRGSGCDAIFVDEPVTSGGSSDRVVEFDHGRVVFVGGGSLAETAMWSVLVVVRYEFVEESVQLALVPDQGPVK